MTEDEAKAKWCPLVRFHGTPSDDSIPNRSGSSANVTGCIASGCMSWRWLQAKRTAQFTADVLAEMRATGANHMKATDAVYKAKGDTYENSEGYCGLAGVPT